MSNAPISASLSCEYDYTKSKSEYPFFCIECMEPCDKDVCDTCGGEANNRWLLCECEDFETLQKWLPESIEVKQLRARIAELEAAAQWHPASEPPPSEINVLCFYKNSLGKGRIVRATYYNKFEAEATDMDYWDYSDIDYKEDTDTYYCPEGYYESNENDDVQWKISETVTHWRDLPPMPEKGKME